jgi:hypothetical protein
MVGKVRKHTRKFDLGNETVCRNGDITMFNHRRKTIGKSVYYISEHNGAYIVKEIYNDTTVAKSKYTHYNIDDALRELATIRCEQYYTDTSRGLCF